MSLPPLAPDPYPTATELDGIVRRRGHASDVRGIERRMAQIFWRIETRERDPNAFHVPFVEVGAEEAYKA